MLKMTFGNKTITTEKNAFVMGIVNATPDSFWKESRGGLEKAFELIDQGADILDIGGESTRPGFTEVPVEDEINRIVPLIKEIRKKSDIVISVDTRKAAVFKAASEVGADIFNDVSAFEDDKDSAKICAETGASVILMHRFLGNEAERVTNPAVVKEVSEYLLQRITFALESGVAEDKIIIDPGIGFGKTYQENLDLIKAGNAFCGGKYPLLMALSRKRCIGTMTGKAVEERMAGSVAANLISVQKGAKIVRVHDVAQMCDALNVEKNLSL